MRLDILRTALSTALTIVYSLLLLFCLLAILRRLGRDSELVVMSDITLLLMIVTSQIPLLVWTFGREGFDYRRVIVGLQIESTMEDISYREWVVGFAQLGNGLFTFGLSMPAMIRFLDGLEITSVSDMELVLMDVCAGLWLVMGLAILILDAVDNPVDIC